MMKRTGVILLLMTAIFVQTGIAFEGRTTGIGFRGTYWKPTTTSNMVHVSTGLKGTQVDVGNGGGYIYLFSRINDYTFVELTFGAVGQVETHNENYYQSETDVNAVTPLLLGLRHELFEAGSRTALQPYLALGAGPYWFSDVFVQETFYGIDTEVSVDTQTKFGGYLGGGVNFMFTSWMGLNFDLKYHFVNFDKSHAYSGYEYGMGLFFTWGRYKSKYVKRYRWRERDKDITIHID